MEKETIINEWNETERERQREAFRVGEYFEHGPAHICVRYDTWNTQFKCLLHSSLFDLHSRLQITGAYQ
jgi:hypothetical protein